MNRPNHYIPGVQKVLATRSTHDSKSSDVKINSFSSAANNETNSWSRWEDNREEQSNSRGSRDCIDRVEVSVEDTSTNPDSARENFNSKASESSSRFDIIKSYFDKSKSSTNRQQAPPRSHDGGVQKTTSHSSPSHECETPNSNERRAKVNSPPAEKEVASIAQRVCRYETPKINTFGHSPHGKSDGKDCKEIELQKVIKSQAKQLENVEKQLSEAKATVDHLSRKLLQYEQEGKQSPPGSPNEVEGLKRTILAKNAQVESQANLIQQLETELQHEAAVHKLQVDEMIEENLDLKQKIKYQAETHSVRAKHLQESISQLEDIGKPETMMSLEREQKDLKKIILEMTSKQEELEFMLLKRTQQSFEWKRRAMNAETRLGLTESSESTHSEEDGQGSYLQEVMDRQAQAKKSGKLWKVFGKGRESP